jgi:hypothetical protein
LAKNAAQAQSKLQQDVKSDRSRGMRSLINRPPPQAAARTPPLLTISRQLSR